VLLASRSLSSALRAPFPAAFGALQPDQWERAAGAILTTDTRPKLRTATLEVDGRACVITGIAKGAGMICPNLATMLAFIATDAAISQSPLLEELLRNAVAKASIALPWTVIPRPMTP
jgi:glutamate N-acetyltransferase/amino-acid N-acetyltransferase